MAKLDTPWALDELRQFLHATDQIPYDNSHGGVLIAGTHMRSSETEASERAYVTEQILNRVLPSWRKRRPETDSEYMWLRDQAARAKAALQQS